MELASWLAGPAAGWTPPAGWKPDPGWPAPPAGWEFWPTPRSRCRRSSTWFLAAGLSVPVSAVLLAVSLFASSLALVYLALLSGVAWVPLGLVGLVLLRRPSTARTERARRSSWDVEPDSWT